MNNNKRKARKKDIKEGTFSLVEVTQNTWKPPKKEGRSEGKEELEITE